METANANVENVNVTKVMLESFVLANLMNVQYRKKTVKFAVAMENVTHVLPTMFLDVPAKMVGLKLIVRVQNLMKTVKMAFMINPKYALEEVNANAEYVNVTQIPVENFARRKQILFVRPWGFASWEKLNPLMMLTKSVLQVMRRIDLAKISINSVKRKTK